MENFGRKCYEDNANISDLDKTIKLITQKKQ